MSTKEAILLLEHICYDDFNLLDYQIKGRLEAIEVILKENQKLKKQVEELEENSANAINKQVARGIELVNQQKEFIKWLKEKIKVTEDKLDKYDELVMQGEETDIEYYESMINKGIFDAYKVCLSKYKNIVGGK